MDKLSWKALEYKQTDKTADWYWAVGIIAIASVVTSIIVGDGLFAIFIVIAVLTLLMFSIRKPLLVDVTIDRRGITVGSEKYPFATLEHFWVDITKPDDEKIILKSKKMLMPIVVIPINDHDHLAVRDLLLKFLPEQELREPASHKVMEKLGF